MSLHFETSVMIMEKKSLFRARIEANRGTREWQDPQGDSFAWPARKRMHTRQIL